jgi:uncharacterized protein YjeT (DUF2065 family)
MKPTITLARAKIMWGHDRAEVRRYLEAQGIVGSIAEKLLTEFTEERLSEIRRTGRRKILVGVTLLILAAVYFSWWFAFSDSGIGYRRGRGAGVVAFVGLYGLWKLIDGIFFVARPRDERRCVTEIAE